jgi:hypothetical protein
MHCAIGQDSCYGNGHVSPVLLAGETNRFRERVEPFPQKKVMAALS